MRNIVIGLILSGLVACTCAPPRPPDAGVDAGGGDASLDVGLELDGGGVDGGSSDAGIELDDGGFDGGVVDGGSSDAGPLARWTAVFPPGRRFHSLTWDGDLGRVVMFGGWVGNKAIADMWEWDGARWVERTHTVSPSARGLHGMAWDSVRHRLVLFGGAKFVPDGDVDAGPAVIKFGETWEHDGATWVERFPLMAPSAREGHQMAYDSARQRVVLVGGNAGALSDETWEWDGTTWSEKASSPPTTFGTHGLAYDEARSRIVLLAPSGTWEWDGLTWLQKQSTTPPGITTARMAWDPTRRRIILTGTVNDTWEWDGASWVAFAGTVPERRFHGMAFDQASGRMVVFGGMDPDSVFQADTWERDGISWSQRAAPNRLWGCQSAFDEARGRQVTFGGLSTGVGIAPFPCTNGTWEWNGLDWVERFPMTSPPPRCWNSIAYDGARQRVVMFGGIDVSGNPTAETWEWDGVDWTLRTPVTSPSPRREQGMAWDEDRGRVVLFGGWNGAALADVWEWDGTNWTERLPPLSPPAQRHPVMAYDKVTRRMVVVGESGTWEWDGAEWSGGSPTPAFRSFGSMAWDPIRGRMVALVNISGTLDWETWERNGSVWVRPAMALGGVPSGGELVWNGDQQRMMMSGPDIWFYDP